LARQVFLSHATEDRETANQVCAALEAEGISCWIAPRDVKAGTDYAAAILDAIRSSDLVLLIFSSFADSSPYVLREIERAVAYKRPILALRMDDTAPSASIEYYVNVWRRFEATTGVEKKQEEIAAAVREAMAAPRSARRSRRSGAKGSVILGRWSRRKWGIALVSLLVVAAVGLGLGLGLTRDKANSGGGLEQERNTWTDLEPSGTLPSARASSSMAYDPGTRRLIMFGGGTVGGSARFNDTWAYDPAANTWTELSPRGESPSERDGSSMVYDPSSGLIILFGGMYNDTWAYDATANAWTDLSPAGTVPSVRDYQSMVYAPPTGQAIMFGGHSDTEGDLGDTWAYRP